MRGKVRTRAIALLALGAIVGTMLVGTPASAHVTTSINHIWKHIRGKADKRYVKASGVLTIPGVAFVETRTAAPSGGSCVPESIAGDGTYYAPVNLPHGARVTRLTHFWWDNNAGADSTASLVRVPLPSSSGPFNMASASSSGSDGIHTSSTTTTITAPVIINNRTNNYFIRVTQPGSVCVDAVQVFYK